MSVYMVLTRGSLDERKWELLRQKGAASNLTLNGQLAGAQEKASERNKVLREVHSRPLRQRRQARRP